MNLQTLKTLTHAVTTTGLPTRRSGRRPEIAAFPLSRRELRRIIAETLG